MNMRESIPLMLLAATLLAGCAGPQALSEAEEMARFGQHEAAVQRLVALGFGREQAAEAYVACDRNEMLAANFLMDHQ